MKKTVLIGYGYWGKNIFRNLIKIIGLHNIIVIDTDKKKINELVKSFPSLQHYTRYEEIANNREVENVIIATPTLTHYVIALFFLKSKKNVLVEKPTTTSYKEAINLKKVADKNKVLLMTDYIFLYNPVVDKMKSLFNDMYLGKVNYIDSTRINLGVYQNDTNVLWDLACHDISIINYLVDEKPTHVRAIGRVNNEFKVEDISYVFFYYPSGMLVQINSSWASPVKIRKMIIGGEKKMLIFDDIDPSSKLKIYEYQKSSNTNNLKNELTDYRLGSVYSPKLESEEPLKLLLTDFLASSKNKTTPKIKYESTLDIIKFLEKANESLMKNGELVKM